MQYISLINQFWRMRRTTNFNHADVDLYFYLLNEANEQRWQIPFSHSTRLICAALSMSNKILAETRNRLKQKGLIDFKEGSRSQAAQYYIIDTCVSVGNTTRNTTRNESRNTKSAPSLNKEETREENELNIQENNQIYPTLSECIDHFTVKIGALYPAEAVEREAVKFYNFYESNGWMVGVNPMKSWVGAAGGWIARNKINTGGTHAKNTGRSSAQTNKRGGSIGDLRSVLAKWDDSSAGTEQSSAGSLLQITGSVGS